MTSVDDYGSTHASLKFERKKNKWLSMDDYGSTHTSLKFERKSFINNTNIIKKTKITGILE